MGLLNDCRGLQDAFYKRPFLAFVCPATTIPVIFGVDTATPWQIGTTAITFPTEINQPESFEFRALQVEASVTTGVQTLILQWGDKDGLTVPAASTAQRITPPMSLVAGPNVIPFPLPGVGFGPYNLPYCCTPDAANAVQVVIRGVIVPVPKGALAP